MPTFEDHHMAPVPPHLAVAYFYEMRAKDYRARAKKQYFKENSQLAKKWQNRWLARAQSFEEGAKKQRAGVDVPMDAIDERERELEKLFSLLGPPA